jgi:hypothetical protein
VCLGGVGGGGTGREGTWRQACRFGDVFMRVRWRWAWGKRKVLGRMIGLGGVGEMEGVGEEEEV